ncbi:MAG: nucleotidyltransferase domain-containing protein [Candidatus Thorarchaeota archaeon]
MGQAALIPCCTLVATIKVLESPIEGCFIVTIDNLIFEVKGVVHPKDRIIAYLRYIPSIDSDSGFRKVYNLEERENYLRENYPDYLWYSEPYGRLIQSVSMNKIESILDPVDYLAQLQSTDKITHLEQVSVTLAKKLVETTEIDWRDIGLTGSQLIGVAGKDSDIDLVIYGSSACRKFYSNLSARINSILEIEKYSGKLLEDHVSFRWGAHNELRSLLLEIERDKLLQGLIGNYHFFIRLVKTPSDLDYDYGDLSYQMLGHQKVSGKVIDSSDSIFTPCEYQVTCVSNPNLEKLVSYRGRFTEHVSAEDKFEAFGRLELVIDHKVDSQYMQLVLGELPSDYLIPIK